MFKRHMARRELFWVNTPVLNEAITRYEEGSLPRSLKLWIEKLLDINQIKNKDFE